MIASRVKTQDTHSWHTYWQARQEIHTACFLELAQTHAEAYGTLAQEHDNLIIGMNRAYEAQQWAVLIDFASILCRPGRGYLGLRGYWPELERQLPRAIQAAKTTEKWGDWAALQQNLAVLYIRYGRMAQAKKLCHQALTIFQQQDDTRRIAETRGLLATIARHQGRYSQAKTELLKILGIFQQLNDERNIAITLNQLGQLAESAQEWEQALAYHAAELHVEEQADNPHGFALAQWGIGNIHYRLADLEKADQYYRQAYDVLAEIGDQHNLIRLLAQRANLTNRLGKATDAIVLFIELIKGAQQLGDQLTVYNTMFNLARLYRQEGKLAKAVNMLQAAIEIGEIIQINGLEKDKQALQIVQQELETAEKSREQ